MAAIPIGAAAAVVGGVALAAVATVGIASLLSGPEDEAPLVAGRRRPRRRRPRRHRPRRSDPTPTPSDIPTVQPTDLPTEFPEDDASQEGVDDSTSTLTDDDTADEPTTTDEEPVPDEPTTPPDEPTPPPAAPPEVQLELPDGGLALQAGVPGQQISVGVRNAGGTAATDLVADVTLPNGVTLDGISAVAFAGTTGRFAPVSVAGGWICTDVPTGAVHARHAAPADDVDPDAAGHGRRLLRRFRR